MSIENDSQYFAFQRPFVRLYRRMRPWFIRRVRPHWQIDYLAERLEWSHRWPQPDVELLLIEQGLKRLTGRRPSMRDVAFLERAALSADRLNNVALKKRCDERLRRIVRRTI